MGLSAQHMVGMGPMVASSALQRTAAASCLGATRGTRCRRTPSRATRRPWSEWRPPPTSRCPPAGRLLESVLLPGHEGCFLTMRNRSTVAQNATHDTAALQQLEAAASQQVPPGGVTGKRVLLRECDACYGDLILYIMAALV